MENIEKKEVEELNDLVAEKAEKLSEQHNCKVHPLIFGVEEGSDERVVGYIKEPNRMVKLRVLDKSLQSPMSASAEMLDACLIKEESDSRIYDENPANDKFYIGAVMEASKIIEYTRQQFKKKLPNTK